jgi:hypothetical protein
MIFVFAIILVLCIAGSRALKQADSLPREGRTHTSQHIQPQPNASSEQVLTPEQWSLFSELLEREKLAIRERDALIAYRDQRLAEQSQMPKNWIGKESIWSSDARHVDA